MSLDLEVEIAELEVVALRVKAERDEAVRLLRAIGKKGPFKTQVREFLKRIGEAT